MFKTLVQPDENGLVQKTILDVEPYNYVTGSFSYPNDPVIIDNNLTDIYYNRTRYEDGVDVVDRVLIHPYTEQVLSGNLYGGFRLNEQVYQTPVNVKVVNYLSINGKTADSYNPVVSSVGASGELGLRCARFYGTYNDLPSGKGAGLELPAFDSRSYCTFSCEGFVYFDSIPSAYDPIIVSRGGTGIGVGGTTQDSFLVEYDVSSRRLMLNYTMGAAAGGTAGPGYEHYLPLSPIDGVTTNKWHHFAFSASLGITYPSDPMQPGYFVVGVGTFFDGIRCGYDEYVFYDPIAESSTPSQNTLEFLFRTSSLPLLVGCGVGGERPLKGWLDSVLISGGKSPTALRGYDPTLSSVTLPSKEQMAVGEFTLYHLNMKGPLGTSLFPCDTPLRVISTASYISNEESKLGVALISRQKSQAPSVWNGYTLSPWHGKNLFNGVCFGHALTGVSASPCFGINTGSCLVVGSVEQLHGLTMAKKIRANAAEFTISYLLGSTGMYGASGACADFRRLFLRNWGGNTFTFLPTQTNTTQMKFTYDSVVVSGRTGTFFLRDLSSGQVYGVETADIQNVYADIVEYHSLSVRLGASASSRMSQVSGMESLYDAAGFEQEPIVRRVAPQIDEVGILYISNNGRMSKITSRPELVYDSYVTEGVHNQVISGLAGSNPLWYPNLALLPY